MATDTPETNEPASTRAERLTSIRQLSLRDLATPDKSSTTGITSTNEPDKWRKLINASTDEHLTALWERYHTDCQVHGISDPYTSFVTKAKHLTHPLLPEYWDLYLNDCIAKEQMPEPFLTFANRMQIALNTHNIVSSNPKAR